MGTVDVAVDVVGEHDGGDGRGGVDGGGDGVRRVVATEEYSVLVKSLLPLHATPA